jgi:hypothetical protein
MALGTYVHAVAVLAELGDDVERHSLSAFPRTGDEHGGFVLRMTGAVREGG